MSVRTDLVFRTRKRPARHPMNSSDQLEKHLEWLRRLARSLVQDAAAAEDLTHETLLAALRQNEPPRSDLRAWLAGVMRRQAADVARRELRRKDRELLSSGERSSDSPLDDLAQHSVHAVLNEEVDGLPESYREVLLWRYFDDCTPTEIARQRGIPIATVKTRLQRGLAKLRERLDARHGGDGRSWVAALAVFAFPTAKRTVSASAVMAGTVGALVALAFVVTSRSTPPTSLPSEAPDVEVADATLESAVEEAGEDERESVTTPSGATPDSSTPTPLFTTSDLVTGHVVDDSGQPVARLPVLFEGRSTEGEGSPVAITDKDGKFTLRGASHRGLVRALGGRATVAAARVEGTRRTDLTVVVADAQTLSGVVRSTEGQSIPYPRVEWRLPVSRVAARTLPLPNLVWGDEDGSFTIEGAAIPAAELVVSASGYSTRRMAIGAGEVLLQPLEEAVHGTVVDASGVPIAGAWVGSGRELARTGPDGGFRLGGEGPVRAAAPSLLPAKGEREPGMQLVLAGEPRVLAGVLVDHEERPLSGIRVWIDDPTPLRLPMLHESQGFERSNQLAGEVHPSEKLLIVESVLAGAPDIDGQRPVITDAEGRFRIEGLDDRAYQLAAVHPGNLVRTTSPPIAAGSEDAVFQLDADGIVPRVAGQVVDGNGAPVPSAQVMLSVKTQELAGENGRPMRSFRSWRMTYAGEQGAFLFENVAPGDVWLRVEGADLLPQMAPLEGGFEGTLDALRVEVTTLAHLRIEDADRFERVLAFDEAGEPIGLHRVEGGRREVFLSIPLEDGRTPVLQVPRAVASLRLEGPEEALDVPIQLTDAAVVVIRP